MSSGFRDIFINPQERAASADINRLQRFKERDVAELLRYMLNVTGDDENSGTISEYSTLGNPLRGEVINGLLVRPQLGSFDVLVDPGVAMLLQPDGAADESDYKYCKDAGVSVLGVLSIASNSSGSTRIDVIECRLSATPGVVTDTRDVFDTSLGSFSATLVTKERYGVLEYRVRQGTAGMGFPGTTSGWLPLCVASVPNGAGSNNDVTFWDVRPLVSDRVFAPFSMGRTTSLYEENLLAINDTDNGGQVRVSGTTRVSLGDRWVGGIVRRGSPGTDADYVDMLDSANQASGFSLPSAGFVYLYLACPFGLPRWSKYNNAPAMRVPSAPRGIPIVCTAAPRIGGLNNATFNLPTALGLGTGPVGVGQAVCIAACYSSASALRGGIVDGKTQWIWLSTLTSGVSSLRITANGGYDKTAATFTAVPGTHFPNNAKALWIDFHMNYSIPTGQSTVLGSNGGEVEVRTPAGNRICAVGGNRSWVVNGSGGTYSGLVHSSGLLRIPLYPEVPGSNVQSSKNFYWKYDAQAAGLSVSSAPYAAIHGWEF